MVASLGGVARADGPLARAHWEAGLAVNGGPWDSAYQAGALDGPAVGAQLTFGRTFGALRVAAEYEIASVGQSVFNDPDSFDAIDPVRGQLHRLGLAVRGRAMHAQDTGAIGGYLEGGVGRETVLWHGGGRLDRMDVSAGAGIEMLLGQAHVGGFDLGVQLRAAEAPPAKSAVTCTGPCTTATRDQTRDLSVMLHLGFVYGF
ncbi:MAG: hypothetical protein K8W52_06735 [Deltaproteobacteria bacterium]|nr:hypothetical protein [Deltaproteobacteria bacterium]